MLLLHEPRERPAGQRPANHAKRLLFPEQFREQPRIDPALVPIMVDVADDQNQDGRKHQCFRQRQKVSRDPKARQGYKRDTQGGEHQRQGQQGENPDIGGTVTVPNLTGDGTRLPVEQMPILGNRQIRRRLLRSWWSVSGGDREQPGMRAAPPPRMQPVPREIGQMRRWPVAGQEMDQPFDDPVRMGVRGSRGLHQLLDVLRQFRRCGAVCRVEAGFGDIL